MTNARNTAGERGSVCQEVGRQIMQLSWHCHLCNRQSNRDLQSDYIAESKTMSSVKGCYWFISQIKFHIVYERFFFCSSSNKSKFKFMTVFIIRIQNGFEMYLEKNNFLNEKFSFKFKK